jgi:hypothetical protein
MDARSTAVDDAVAFLERLRPSGPWVLTAIMPDPEPGQVYVDTITVFSADDAHVFLVKYDGKRNLYYSVNPTRVATTRKASKTNIAAIEFALADCDPREDETPEDAKARYLEALKTTGVPAPTFIVDSGNGLQFGWRLADPVRLPPLVEGELGSDVETRIKATMERLGAKAGTQNIDRILRLPGTLNLPNAPKRKHGRVVCPATLIEFNDGAFGLASFPLPEPEPKPKPRAKSSRKNCHLSCG